MTVLQKALKLTQKLRKKYHPITLLSENKKTCVSINMPIQGHCKPTKRCIADCYGRSGHTALPSNIRKQQYISQYLLHGDIDELIHEAQNCTSIRLNGIGDLNPGHLPAIFSLAEACPQTEFWGMTRKTDIASQINGNLPNLSLLMSVDVTSPDSVWNYPGPMCFGPRRPEDPVPEDQRIITIFPRHHAGRVIGNIPNHPKDCPAVRHTVSGCLECGRCWKWK